MVAERPDLAALGYDVQRSTGSAVVVAAGVVLVRRMRRASPEQRRVLLPLVAYGILAAALIPVTANWLGPAVGAIPLVVTQVALLAGVPLAFLLSLQRGAFRPAPGVEQLVGWLGTDDETRPALAQALAGTLGDPSMRLHLEEAPDLATPGRGLVEVELGGRRVGAISYDATLIHDPEQVRQAGRVVALAIDRERLTASLRSSRARIVQAADAERRRIAADLHDGLQANLVMLSLQAYELGADPAADAEVRATADELRAGIDDAADRLRRLVHGVMPAPLIERGLYAAVEDLVDRSPVPAALRVVGSDGDLPEHVQSTAYFLVAEGLANAVKHATASRVDVRIERAPATLLVDVSDDGVGSAVAKDDGMGLHSLADRVDVLGGTLIVDSPPNGGTRLTAELPCGS
jgi:signal transduction histidine kinase